MFDLLASPDGDKWSFFCAGSDGATSADRNGHKDGSGWQLRLVQAHDEKRWSP